MVDQICPEPRYDFGKFDEDLKKCAADPAYARQLMPSTLEGCVVRIADVIAYIGKDRQDAMRAKMAEESAFVNEDIGSINSRLQKEAIKEYPELEIDPMEALQELVRYGAGYVDSDLIKVWINESGELVDWLTDLLEGTGNYYMSLEGGVGNLDDPGRDKAYATGHSPHKTDEAAQDDTITLNSTSQEHCDELGVEWKLSTALVCLEQDEDGKVTGIIAQDQNDQHYIRINASKGVIMCAGGYATNTEMLKALQPMTLDMKINYSLGSTCDGSGIKAMMWAGAALDPTHASMMFNRCCCLPTETAGYKTNGKWFWFGEQPFLKVNLKGKRFCNESGPYEFMLHSMEMQPVCSAIP